MPFVIQLVKMIKTWARKTLGYHDEVRASHVHMHSHTHTHTHTHKAGGKKLW